MLIYLHGFNSSGQSRKGRQIRDAFSAIRVVTPTYPMDPDQAIGQLTACLEREIQISAPGEPLMLVGSSLGGFYAQYLATRWPVKLVMINPALAPRSALTPHLGSNRNYYSGELYELAQRHIDALDKYAIPRPCERNLNALLLLDAGDEIIDYRLARQRYADCADVRVFAGGDHAFQHMGEALDLIRAFYYAD